MYEECSEITEPSQIFPRRITVKIDINIEET